MEWSLDWLTLTMKPDKNDERTSEENYGRALGTFRTTLCLGELMDRMENKGKCRYYAERLSYNDVDIKLSSPEEFNTQGFCIEFSSNGLRYFREYLASYGYTLELWCGMFRKLSLDGCITKCTRFDVAMDDKVYDGKRPTLTMQKVLDGICDDDISCKARVWSDDCKDLVSFKRNYKRRGGKGLWGTTVNIGNRKSDTFVRFYDKKVEQEQKGKSLPENLTSWVRCEFEYHEVNAMSAFNAFVDMPKDKLGGYFCGVALNHIRFIDRIASNVSRCPVKRWWKAFLNGATKKYSFPRVTPVRSALAKSVRWVQRQVVAVVATFRTILGEDGFWDFIDACIDEREKAGKSAIKSDIINNFKDGLRAYEEPSGFDRWNYATDISPLELRKNMKQHCWDYYQQFYNIVRTPEKWGDDQARLIGA